MVAVDYALAFAHDDSMWPVIVSLDKDNNPVPAGDKATGFIYVEKRTGTPTPTTRDLAIAVECGEFAKSKDQNFVDFIIIGKDSFYSFADERIVKLN